MLANEKLGCCLAGIDLFEFSRYWNALKDKISELQQLGFHISTYQQKLGVAKANLIARGRPDLASQLDDEIKKAQDDLDKWWKVKGYIDKYLPEWLQQADNPQAPVVPVLSTQGAVGAKTGVSYQTYQPKSTWEDMKGWVSSWVPGLGVAPIVLSVAGIAALAYVVTTGMALLQDYAYKKSVTADVIAGKLQASAGGELIRAGQQPSAVTSMFTGVGTNVGTVLVLGAVGVGLFYMYSTKKVGEKVIGV
jgi:hypothetical protein